MAGIYALKKQQMNNVSEREEPILFTTNGTQDHKKSIV